VEATQDTHDATALRELRDAYPHLQIGTQLYGDARIWEARGANGHPWLMASDDLARFRSALDAATRP
jgi:hypothetical protein